MLLCDCEQWGSLVLLIGVANIRLLLQIISLKKLSCVDLHTYCSRVLFAFLFVFTLILCFLYQQHNRHGIVASAQDQPLSTPVISLNNLPMQTPGDNHSLSTPIFSMATPNIAGAPPSFSSALPSGFPADFSMDNNTESLAHKIAQYQGVPAAALPLIQQQALLQQQLQLNNMIQAG